MDNTESKPLVSVVMSCYNGERFISEAIGSVLSQTYHNFEFIIWDDGSTDGTRDIIESFKDDRIHYYYNSNMGVGRAVRFACERANGTYIARMDSDDICLPDRLEKEVNFLESHKDYVLVSSAIRYIDENGMVYGRSFPCTKDSILKKSLLYTNIIVQPMVMMRRDSYQRAGGYIPIRLNEDRVFWSKLARFGKLMNLSEVLGYYRVLNSSLSHSYNPYSPILDSYCYKMIIDDVVTDNDVELYNKIYDESKKFIIPGSDKLHIKRDNFENMLYKLIGGGSNAERIICKLKNIYYYIRKFIVFS